MSLIDDIHELIRVKPGKKFRLKDHDPAWAGNKDVPKKERKAFAEKHLSEDVTALSDAQDLLYAANTLLDLADIPGNGRGGQGQHHQARHVRRQSAGVPGLLVQASVGSRSELNHDFFWRYAIALPERGRIGIFNRSYYEEVLIVKVHPEILANQRIPDVKPNKEFWQARYDGINDFERHLTQNGTAVILKFFLNISKDEQWRRFLKRLGGPGRSTAGKFSDADMVNRALLGRLHGRLRDLLE